MKRHLSLNFVVCFLVISILLSCTNAFAADGSTLVYITRTGECYHRYTCSYTSSSCIEITLERAVNRGYRPCSRCKPPELTYATPAPTLSQEEIAAAEEAYAKRVYRQERKEYLRKLKNSLSTPTPTMQPRPTLPPREPKVQPSEHVISSSPAPSADLWYSLAFVGFLSLVIFFAVKHDMRKKDQRVPDEPLPDAPLSSNFPACDGRRVFFVNKSTLQVDSAVIVCVYDDKYVVDYNGKLYSIPLTKSDFYLTEKTAFLISRFIRESSLGEHHDFFDDNS